MTDRLGLSAGLAADVSLPDYQRDNHGVGIVHFGMGAFHKAHQAVYTDDALAASGGDWRIAGVSLRSAAPAQELMPQSCLYTVIERNAEGASARVIGSIAAALCLRTDRWPVLETLCAPETKIVSMTVTETGYGIDRNTGGVDPSCPVIAADLADPSSPCGVAGLLVWALGRRRAAGTPPFTILSCDNLPQNGALTRSLLIDFARRATPDLVEHIAIDVAFPSTMVDRITPARTDATLKLAEQLIGQADAAAIECETFRQWVIEDHFPTERPCWEAGGALFTDDVRPYEEMKLRMLNGTHSMIAYAGFLAGHRTVREAMEDHDLSALAARHLAAAAATLGPVPSVDLDEYAADLMVRFANPHLAHETGQIAMDGSQKMPQRLFAPALDAITRGQCCKPFAFAAAVWIRYMRGRFDDGQPYDIRDPRSGELAILMRGQASADDLIGRIRSVNGLVPPELAANDRWNDAVRTELSHMLTSGMRASIQRAASRAA
ncbi:MAG: mannitol dehydrogenase family protein [Rhodobacteraceae bacterium]|nr:mannitol dehydrogenase family protein [Paracoccaceae bacterium]MCY4195685.1 mannitol dehydrogenase family protein [Paracoccaceae bacterium]MCY4326409.1 mannitol dehydrogenase family protein [Paracoccaceae bacterium]